MKVDFAHLTMYYSFKSAVRQNILKDKIGVKIGCLKKLNMRMANGE